MRRSFPQLCLLARAASLPAQDAVTIAADVGLTIQGATPGASFGSPCSVIPLCQVYAAGGIARGTSRLVTVHGAPFSAFALAIAASPAVCVAYPFQPWYLNANALQLQQPLVIAFGTTGPLVPGFTCPLGVGPPVGQGIGTFQLNAPAGAPAGLQFVLQGLVASSVSWMTGFTPTVQATLL